MKKLFKRTAQETPPKKSLWFRSRDKDDSSSSPTESNQPNVAGISTTVPPNDLGLARAMPLADRVTNDAHGQPAIATQSSSSDVNSGGETDLWVKAYNQLILDPETKGLMESYQRILESMAADTKDIENPQQQMSTIVEKKVQYFTSQQWKLHLKGKEVSVRETIDSIVKTILVVKDFGSSVAGLDPVHAGLPWAGICVLLTVITNDSAQHTTAMDGLKFVTDILPRYTAVDNNLGIGQDPTDLRLVQDSLTRLYALILRYQATAVCFFGRSTFSRFIRNIVPGNQWADLLENIKSAVNECDKCIELVRWHFLDLVIRQQKQDIQHALETIQENENRNEKVLAWASEVRNQDDYQFVLDDKLGESNWNSGQWLLENSKFLSWIQAEGGVFWLQGAVGTGKSCLTALVIKSLSSEQAPERIAYFYCSKDTNRPHRSQTNDILRNIVAQLSSAKMDFILREFREHGEGKATLSTKDCTRLLSELVRALGACTLIIDALDECSNPYDLLEALKTVSEDTKQLRIFISSRFEIKVASEFPEAFCVPITPEDNQKDIANYVNREIERRRNIINRRNRGEPEQMNDNLATELSEILQERAHSMFRWVELQIDLFLSLANDPLHHDTIEEQLRAVQETSSLPELDDAYDQVYKRNTRDKAYGKLAVKALQWVFASYGNLHIDELQAAVAIRVDFTQDPGVTTTSLLNRICSNFITADKKGMVQFAHISVREYLEKRKMGDYSPLVVHTQAAESCLAFLQQPDFNFDTVDYQPGQFATYAAVYWPFHCEAAATRRTSGNLKYLFDKFLDVNNAQLLSWMTSLPRFYGDFYSSFRKFSPKNRLEAIARDNCRFFLACRFGFHEILDPLPSHLDVWTTYYEEHEVTGLMLASAEGHVAIVKTLLEAHVDVNNSTRNSTALHWAARFNRDDVARLLLNAGADVNRVTSQGTPLFQAVEYKSDRTFDLILEAINSVPGTDGGKLAALWHASENGYVWALKRFVASNTDVHTKRSNGCNALSDAVAHGHYESSRLLIDAGIDFEGQASYLGRIFHGNPLYIASKKGNSKIVRLLVERGANVNACNYYQQTALHNAADQGGVTMIQLLLDHGADVHARNQIGETALHFAARKGDLKAIAMLLDRGADIDAWCEVDGSALFIAWTWGHIDAVALLIERGANITEY